MGLLGLFGTEFYRRVSLGICGREASVYNLFGQQMVQNAVEGARARPLSRWVSGALSMAAVSDVLEVAGATVPFKAL